MRRFLVKRQNEVPEQLLLRALFQFLDTATGDPVKDSPIHTRQQSGGATPFPDFFAAAFSARMRSASGNAKTPVVGDSVP
jgi:hypothetical protein